MARRGPSSSLTLCAIPLGLALALSGAAHAQVTTGTAPATAEPTPQSLVLLPETGLNVDLGLAVRGRPVHLGSDSYKVEAVPVIDGQWGPNLHFSLDDGIQYTLVHWDRLKLGPDLEYRQAYNDRLAPRATRTANAVEVGGFAKLDLTYAELDVRFRKAVDGYDGYSADATLDTLFPVIGRKWFVALEARTGWADRKYALNAFGHGPPPLGAPPEASGPIGDYYSAGGQVALIYLWRPRTKFILAASDDVILSPTRLAAGTATRNAAVLLLAVTHRFTWGR